jgi:ABC-type transport system involved in multi-copper enzyme maturation permease subunit
MSRELVFFCIGLVIALLLGFLTARSSSRREKIHAGLLAEFFHFLGATFLVSILLSVLMNIILHSGFMTAFLWAAGLMLSGFICLLIFAVLENPARTVHKPKEHVWTEKEARTSGL